MRLSEYDDEDIIEEVKHRGMTFKGFSTKELVSELRKRDGVDAIDVPAEGSYDLEVFGKRGRTLRNTILSEIDYEGAAIILRITD